MSNSIVRYHYTSLAGCHGIIESGKLWFTDHRFLNDEHELTQGLSALLKHFPEESGSFNTAFEIHRLNTHYCVLSLSKSHKILSQWRGYAADGTGIAIGFSAQFLEKSGINLVECKYDGYETLTEELATTHESFIKLVHQSRPGNNTSVSNFVEWVGQHKEQFTALINDVIAIKNPVFREEQEVRAVRSYNYGEVKMRLSGQLMIPYYEVNLWDDDTKHSEIERAIYEIWLGPKCDNRNKTALKALLIEHCDIQKYDCGYR